MTLLLSILGVVFAFGVVIFVHEFGHFIVAKKSGIKVEQFSFGFGPEIFGWVRGETRYSVNWIPLGGYVKPAGEAPEGYEGPALEKNTGDAPLPTDEDKSRYFYAKPWTTRIAVAFAGPVMNYILAFLMFSGILLFWGEPHHLNKTQVGDVLPGYPAEAAGIQPGDHVVNVQGKDVDDFAEVAATIHGRAGLETQVTITREGELKTFEVVPVKDEKMNIGLIGIRPADPVVEHQRIGVVGAVKKGAYQCWFITKFTLVYLGEKIWSRERPDVAGPIGITTIIASAVKRGLKDFLTLIAYISVAIGLFNLFPIPLLDGGHVVYYLIEGITGKPVSTRVMSRVNVVGFALLMFILVFATINDIQRIATQRKEKAPAVQQD